MGRFNLLDEPWISVIVDEKGTTKKVSMIEIFEQAQDYYRLGGDTKAQDFAVFRVLLSVVHTVFSRFDAEGQEYDFFPLDDNWKPENEIEDEDEQKEYQEALLTTWNQLWKKNEFPVIVRQYLEKWRDRFYLFDEEYPFYQVTEKEIHPENTGGRKAGSVSGKNMNRLISESGNKIALFSPRYESNANKEKLTPAQIARWLITFQGYTGLSDKVIFGKEKYKASKGWLFDIGGLYIEGDNLFQTLMLNCALVHPEEKYRGTTQRPCWEYTAAEVVDRYFRSDPVDNLAELYTNWSRAIYIDPETDIEKAFSFDIVKLPEIQHDDQFLELMTLWRYNTAGENKNKNTPRKHRFNQAIWRSFGLITLIHHAATSGDPSHNPGIMEWLNTISRLIEDKMVSLVAISMQDDGNATSWVPVNEIFDVLNIRESIVTDIQEAGWVPRIHEAVEETKNAISRTYREFIKEIKEIRNLSSDGFVDREVEELYFLVDEPFRDWLVSLQPNEDKDDKIFAWRQTLKKIVLGKARQVYEAAGPRDYRGIMTGKEEQTGRIRNIATAYNTFTYWMNKNLPDKGGQ